MSKAQLEYALQCQIADYLRLQYPSVIFQSDLAGIKLTMGQAVKAKRIRAGRGYPDLFIARASRGYHGFFGELKIDSDEILTKAGSLRNVKHVQEQQAFLDSLFTEGYYAVFLCGFDEAKKSIDWYLRED